MIKRLFTKENKEETKKALMLLVVGAILIPIAIPIAVLVLKIGLFIALSVFALYITGKVIAMGAKTFIENKIDEKRNSTKEENDDNGKD